MSNSKIVRGVVLAGCTVLMCQADSRSQDMTSALSDREYISRSFENAQGRVQNLQSAQNMPVQHQPGYSQAPVYNIYGPPTVAYPQAVPAAVSQEDGDFVTKGASIGAGAGVILGALGGVLLPLAVYGATMKGALLAVAGFFGAGILAGLAGALLGAGIGLLIKGFRS
ncbi:MAG: hypothetical protein AAB091_06210 [Elusimicrobiota bacterium]